MEELETLKKKLETLRAAHEDYFKTVFMLRLVPLLRKRNYRIEWGMGGVFIYDKGGKEVSHKKVKRIFDLIVSDLNQSNCYTSCDLWPAITVFGTSPEDKDFNTFPKELIYPLSLSD